jgi:RecB family exonuclease
MSLAEQLKKNPRPKKTPGIPWAGPCGEGPQGGITQSLISRYLACKERMRIMTIEGLKAADKFEAPREFGNIWHAMEEALAGKGKWQDALHAHCRKLSDQYPMSREEIALWHDKAGAMFPLYVDHWAAHPDVQNRTPLLQEQKFDVFYVLPSGRKVRLRGRWDAVDVIDEGKVKGIYIQENKSKSSIDAQKIKRQLSFDLQMMTYFIALDAGRCSPPVIDVFPKGRALLGVRYNVVRRAAHKSPESMLKKLEEDRADGRIREWFDRWRCEIGPDDVAKFRRECLDPVLENLADDFEWWSWCKKNGASPFDPDCLRADEFKHHRPRHFRLPFGIYSVIAEGGVSDLDAFLENGSKAGLQQVSDLFPELS